jgi:hypothetical protein
MGNIGQPFVVYLSGDLVGELRASFFGQGAVIAVQTGIAVTLRATTARRES